MIGCRLLAKVVALLHPVDQAADSLPLCILAHENAGTTHAWRSQDGSKSTRSPEQARGANAVSLASPPELGPIRAKSVARKFEIPQAAQADLGRPDRGGKTSRLA